MVEALVALVVLAIGMLGIAALYVESLRAGRSALLRSEAVILASDMVDRIRANPTAQLAYAKTADATGTLNTACQPAGAGCTPAQMAAHDIASWVGLVDDRYDNPAAGQVALPSGRGTISVDNTTTPATYTITIIWAESGQSSMNSYVLELQV